MNEKDFLDALVAVKDYYEDAFDKIFQYTLALIALIGVVVPLIAALFQWRSLKSEKDVLEKQIKDEIRITKDLLKDDAKKEIEERISREVEILKNLIEEKTRAVSIDLDKKFHKLEGAAFHLQGNMNEKNELYALAAHDFCLAARRYLFGEDETNGKRCLKLLVDNLSRVDKDHVDYFEFETKISELIEYLETISINGRYQNEIGSIKRGLKEAKKRVPVSEDGK